MVISAPLSVSCVSLSQAAAKLTSRSTSSPVNILAFHKTGSRTGWDVGPDLRLLKPRIVRPRRMTPQCPTRPPEPDVIGLVAADKKIHAIKRYRELTGVDLREAKAVIDGL